VFAQDDGGGADPEMSRLPALEFASDLIQIRKEGPDEGKSFSPSGVSAKGRR